MNWVTEELKYADLGDTRRNKRLVKIVEDLADQPNVSVAKAKDICCMRPVARAIA